MFDNSIIEATVFAPLVRAIRVAGTPASRQAMFRIWNATNSVDISGQARIGRDLVSGSSVGAQTLAHLSMIGRYTVDSAAPRTFRLQFASTTATDVEAMILREIRQ